jgi:hypothetical protein
MRPTDTTPTVVRDTLSRQAKADPIGCRWAKMVSDYIGANIRGGDMGLQGSPLARVVVTFAELEAVALEAAVGATIDAIEGRD